MKLGCLKHCAACFGRCERNRKEFQAIEIVGERERSKEVGPRDAVSIWWPH